MRPRLLLIYTGGTIGMIQDPDTLKLKPFDFDHLIDNVPKVKMLDYEIENLEPFEPIDSSNMTPHHWGLIAHAIGEHYAAYDGFVILHGTDTMAYTASALSFMLENLAKPVIITGSQLPIGEVRTDGEENLITALEIAAAKTPSGESVVQEVAILFENYLWRGNRATKHSATNFNAFKSYGYPHLAHIGLSIQYNFDALMRIPCRRPLNVQASMQSQVAVIDLFPGLTASQLRHQLSAPGLKGVVMRTYGAGNAPTAPDFIEAVRNATDRGVVVVNVSQCEDGVVIPIYSAGDTLAGAGVVPARDMTVEATLTKMMHLFGLGLSASQVKELIGQNLCGEISE